MFNITKEKNIEIKQQRKEKKRQEKEHIKRKRKAQKLLKQVTFVDVETILMRNQTEYFVLARKDGTYMFCFTIGGISLEGLNDDDFRLFYTDPLVLFLISTKQAYFKFIEVPIDFTTKLTTTKEQYNHLTNDEGLRRELYEDDISFFELLQEERILQTLPICFIDCADIEEVGKVIGYTQTIAGLNLHYLNAEQLTIIVNHLNNVGGMLPAFDVL